MHLPQRWEFFVCLCVCFFVVVFYRNAGSVSQCRMNDDVLLDSKVQRGNVFGFSFSLPSLLFPNEVPVYERDTFNGT